jgi:hypothetical protein
MKNKSGKRRGWIFIIFILLAIFLIWGFIGGQQAQKIGVTCDAGIGDNFCLKWHTNIIGQTQEFLEDTGNTIKDLVD